MVLKGPLKLVKVKTTLPAVPYPPSDSRTPIVTSRLVLRPLVGDDIDALHEIRTQPEVMIWTARGTPDPDKIATAENIGRYLPPNDVDTYNWAICLASGELIGVGGSLLRKDALGWPALGYMLRKEAWGKGYATEFVRAFLEAWWALPRAELDLEVDKSTVEGGDVKKEFIVAVIVGAHAGSRNVVAKSGFELVKVWEEIDLHDLAQDPDSKIDLYAYAVGKPE